MNGLRIGDEIELLDGSKVRIVGYPVPTIKLTTIGGETLVRVRDNPSREPDSNRLLLSNGKELLLTTDSDLSGAYVVMKMGTQVGSPQLKRMVLDAAEDFAPLYSEMMAWLNQDGALN